MTLDTDLTDATWGEPQDRQPASVPALDEASVTALWNVAKLVTHDVSEQTWLVVHCVTAGRDADWLETRATTSGRLFSKPQPLGIFGDDEVGVDDDGE